MFEAMTARPPSVPAPEDLRFAVMAVDCALFTIRNGSLFMRVIAVTRLPHYKNTWAMPGGLILPHETTEQAIARLLADKGHVASRKLHIEQLFTFSEVNRDPRGRVVSVAYLGLIPWDSLSDSEQADTADATWIPVQSAKKLAYDHDAVLKAALARLRSKVTYTTLIAFLLPEAFTLTELESAYECLLRKKLDKRNFRKKILKLKILKALNKKKRTGRSRPAELYRFASASIQEIGSL